MKFLSNFFSLSWHIVLAVFCLASPAFGGIIPVFNYQFPASGSNLVTNTAVTDLSTAGNNATASGFTGTGLSAMVPEVAPDGAMSLNLGRAKINTIGTSLLESRAVADAGGYTFDTWFYTTLDNSTHTQKIIDYAGTENITIVNGVLNLWLSNNNVFLPNEVPVSLNTWHHVVVQFDTLGNDATGDPSHSGYYRVTGELTAWFDGTKILDSKSLVKDGYGDSLGRSISVGSHPGGSEYFNGRIYNPQVSLGVSAVPEPSVLTCLVLGSLGLLFYRKRK